MAEDRDLDDMKRQVEKGLRLFEEWPRKHLSLQDTAFPKEALCSICYLSGLEAGNPEQRKHAVIVLCPSPSGYIQIYEWDGGPVSGVLKATRKYASDSTAFESSVKGLVDSFLGQPASLMELIAAGHEAQDAIDMLLKVAESGQGISAAETVQAREAMKGLLNAVNQATQRGPQYPCPTCGAESRLVGLPQSFLEVTGYSTFRCQAGHQWYPSIVEDTGNGHIEA